MFQNRVLKRMLGHKRENLPRDWGSFNNEELHNSHCRETLLKSRGDVWHKIRMEAMRYINRTSVEILKGKNYVVNLSEDGRIILKYILNNVCIHGM
jgi:hypothetical protein